MGADNVQRLGQGACLVLHGKQEDEPRVVPHAGPARAVLAAAQHGEAGRVVGLVVDSALQQLQAVQFRRFLRGDGGGRRIVHVPDLPGRYGGIHAFNRLPSPVLQVFLALMQRLAVAVNPADGVQIRLLTGHQPVTDGQIQHLVDIEASGEQQIHHRSHLTGVAVLQRQHRTVALSAFHGAVGLLKPVKPNELSLRKQPPGRDVGEGALDAAVGNLPAADQGLLIPAADVHQVSHESHIGSFRLRIGDPLPVAGDQRLLPGRVPDGQSFFLLIGRDLPHGLHAPRKQLRHLFIRLINDLPGFFKLVHLLLSFPGRRRIPVGSCGGAFFLLPAARKPPGPSPVFSYPK